MVGVKLPNAHSDLQAVSSKFARKYSGPYRVVKKLPSNVSYEIEDAITGLRKKVNRSNLKLYALPSEEPPSVPDIPRHLVGLPILRQRDIIPTREAKNFKADLPREAEDVFLPVGVDAETIPSVFDANPRVHRIFSIFSSTLKSNRFLFMQLERDTKDREYPVNSWVGVKSITSRLGITSNSAISGVRSANEIPP